MKVQFKATEEMPKHSHYLGQIKDGAVLNVPPALAARLLKDYPDNYSKTTADVSPGMDFHKVIEKKTGEFKGALKTAAEVAQAASESFTELSTTAADAAPSDTAAENPPGEAATESTTGEEERPNPPAKKPAAKRKPRRRTTSRKKT